MDEASDFHTRNPTNTALSVTQYISVINLIVSVLYDIDRNINIKNKSNCTLSRGFLNTRF